MKHTLKNGKVVNIPDKTLDKLVATLEVSLAEAIDIYLADNDLEQNEEQEQLHEVAKKTKIKLGAGNSGKAKKPRTAVVSDEKKKLFTYLYEDLFQMYGRNVEILKENKLIQVKIGDLTFKVDLIQQRPPKK